MLLREKHASTPRLIEQFASFLKKKSKTLIGDYIELKGSIPCLLSPPFLAASLAPASLC